MAPDAQHHAMDGFSLGDPALVCRWRLAGGTLLLENRHLRALGRRVIKGELLPPELLAWAKQHIEWTLAEGSAEYPDGVLMLIVDGGGSAAMAVGPYEPLPLRDSRTLIARARDARREQDLTDVAPETLFAHVDDCIVAAMAPSAPQSGCTSLVTHLSATLGIPVIFRPELLDQLSMGLARPDGIFLASDEHGIVSASDYDDSVSDKYEASYRRLVQTERSRRMRRS